ncbi:MAG: hypothetical protein HC846_07360 [Blastocatellia bacterium]|nr:hypothetical protein [Blastocatellia bacterium]
MSDAVIGETALFFLGKYQIRPHMMRNLKETCELKKQVDLEIAENDFYYISHSGYGRMPIEKKNGLDNVSILYGQVFAPKNIKITKKYIREYTSVDLVKLNDITKEVLKHSNNEPRQDLDDDLLNTDENLKQILAYRKMSDKEFDEVCEGKPVTTQSENCEPEELSFFEKIWNFIFG